MPFASLHHRLHALAQDALHLWDLPKGATASLLNVAENLTYLVTLPTGAKAVLRLHRKDYHSKRAILSELAWLDALRRDRVIEVPAFVAGHDGEAVQWHSSPDISEGRHFVLFGFIEGTAPNEKNDLTPGFKELGRIAAKCHDHALGWDRPTSFERLTWDADAVFGASATWGDWRAAPGVDPGIQSVLERLERSLISRLETFGKAEDRYNLIHADMRLANLLVSSDGKRLIDFDDCGFGWFMYDFAAAISFIEDDPRIPDLKSAWLEGYRSVRPLDPVQEAEIDTMIMLRRMALLAWIGSHMDAPEPQALAPGFAETTADLACAYLDGLSEGSSS
jgi:Ser/Thr protein kinase RdoA (MazF antagonist)